MARHLQCSRDEWGAVERTPVRIGEAAYGPAAERRHGTRAVEHLFLHGVLVESAAVDMVSGVVTDLYACVSKPADVVGFDIQSRIAYHLIRVDTDVAEEPGDQIVTLSRRTGSELTVNEVTDGRDRGARLHGSADRDHKCSRHRPPHCRLPALNCRRGWG